MLRLSTITRYINEPHYREKAEKVIIPVAVAGLATAATYKDFKKADEDEKKNLVFRNTLILAGTSIGSYYGIKHLKKPGNLSRDKSFQENAKTVLHLYLHNLCVPFFGIVTGFTSGEIAQRLFPFKEESKTKQDQIKEHVDKQINKMMIEKTSKETKNDKNKLDLIKYMQKQSEEMNQVALEPGTIGKAYGYAGIGLGDTVDTIFDSLAGFNVGKQNGFHNRLRKACVELIVGGIIPVTTAVPISAYLGKKLNPKHKVMNFIIKASILIPVSRMSTYLGEKAADRFNDQITDKLIERAFWEEISNRETAILKSMNNQYSRFDNETRNNMHKALRSINEIKSDKVISKNTTDKLTESQQ